MRKTWPLVLPFALVLACSSNSGKGDEGGKDAAVSADGVPVPNLPIGASIAAGSPQLTLAAGKVSVEGKEVAKADLHQLRAKLDEAMGEALAGALAEAKKGAGDKPLLIVADAQLSFASLGVALARARAAGFDHAGLVVQTKPGEYSMVPVRIADEGAKAAGGVDLHVVIQSDGYGFWTTPPSPGPDGKPTRATIPLKEESTGLYEVSNWDAETLESKFVELSSRTSASRVTVMVEDEHIVDTLAVTLLALRGPKCADDDGPDCHVAEIVLAPKLSFSGAAPPPPPPPPLDDSKLDLGDKGLIGAGKGDDAKLPPGVNMGKPEVEGALRVDIVQRIVRAHLSEVRACDRAVRSKDPKLAGGVTLELVVAADGKVSSASVGDSSVSDASLGKCLVKAAKKKWRFPKPRDGAKVEISYPFSFAPG